MNKSQTDFQIKNFLMYNLNDLYNRHVYHVACCIQFKFYLETKTTAKLKLCDINQKNKNLYNYKNLIIIVN